MTVTISRARLGALFMAGLFALSTSYPQQYFSPGHQSLDTPTDPRSIAMGESFTAVHSTSSMMYNPAGLAGLKGLSFSFARRNLNHLQSFSMKYVSLTGADDRRSFWGFGSEVTLFEIVTSSTLEPGIATLYSRLRDTANA